MNDQSQPLICLRGLGNTGTAVAWCAIITSERVGVTLVAHGQSYDADATIPPDAPCWQCAAGDLLHACISNIEVQARDGRWIARWRRNPDSIEHARRDLLHDWQPCLWHDDGETA